MPSGGSWEIGIGQFVANLYIVYAVAFVIPTCAELFQQLDGGDHRLAAATGAYFGWWEEVHLKLSKLHLSGIRTLHTVQCHRG